MLSTTEKLRPFAQATGGGIWRLAEAASDPVEHPRPSKMNEPQSYAGSDYAGIKRTGASFGRRVAHLAGGRSAGAGGPVAPGRGIKAATTDVRAAALDHASPFYS